MDDTALMIRLLKRLKVEMNGAVTGAMQERGIVYPLNYGVSVPTIRGIAREYGRSHSHALLLYRQQVREPRCSSRILRALPRSRYVNGAGISPIPKSSN